MIRTVIITLLFVLYNPHVQFVLYEECSSVGSVVKSTKDIGIFSMVWHLVGLSWQQFVNISQISNTLQTSHIKLLNSKIQVVNGIHLSCDYPEHMKLWSFYRVVLLPLFLFELCSFLKYFADVSIIFKLGYDDEILIKNMWFDKWLFINKIYLYFNVSRFGRLVED